MLLTDGETEHEISRVAFVRRNSNNPRASFEVALQLELDKAQEAATTLNEMQQEFEALQAEAAERAHARIKEILGAPSKVLV